MTDYETAITELTIGDFSLRIEHLLDNQQFHDPDGSYEAGGVAPSIWPLFGVVWPAGIRLAELIATEDLTGKRVLELGCGIGLPSIIASARGANVVASDLHPLAGEFLARNLAVNHLPPVEFIMLDWREVYPDLGTFDLVLGSDLLYEPDQPELLSNFVGHHCSGEMILTDPGRKQVGSYNRMLEKQGFKVELIESGKFVRYTRSTSAQ